LGCTGVQKPLTRRQLTLLLRNPLLAACIRGREGGQLLLALGDSAALGRRRLEVALDGRDSILMRPLDSLERGGARRQLPGLLVQRLALAAERLLELSKLGAPVIECRFAIVALVSACHTSRRFWRPCRTEAPLALLELERERLEAIALYREVLPLPVRSFSLAKELGAAGVDRVAALFERRLLGEQSLDVLVAVGKAPLELLGAGGQRSLELREFPRARLEARVLFQQLLLAAFELGSGARILSAEAKAATG